MLRVNATAVRGGDSATVQVDSSDGGGTDGGSVDGAGVLLPLQPSDSSLTSPRSAWRRFQDSGASIVIAVAALLAGTVLAVAAIRKHRRRHARCGDHSSDSRGSSSAHPRRAVSAFVDGGVVLSSDDGQEQEPARDTMVRLAV